MLVSMISLFRRNPARNEDRVYHLRIAANLFGEIVVIRAHGRRGRWLRFLPPEVMPNRTAARQRVKTLIRQKHRRGYLPNNVVNKA
jgi:predicted DNA-binding WGR domain protein